MAVTTSISHASRTRWEELSIPSSLPMLQKSPNKLTIAALRETPVCIKFHSQWNRKLSYKKRKFSCMCLSHPLKQPSILEGSSMEEIYDSLTQRLLAIASLNNSDQKHIIGLAGPPGGGKSTLSNEVASRVNTLSRQRAYGMQDQLESSDVSIVVPMDGFHLYRSQLDMMEDPKEAHARRGAPWTFDPARLLSYLTTLRRQGFMYMPSFDHGVGDPVEDDIFVSPLHKIVIVEGNYLLLEDGLWRDLTVFFDEKWYLDVNIDVAMRRVEKRHILTGNTQEYAKWRVEYNDRKNAELVANSKKNADLVICSI